MPTGKVKWFDASKAYGFIRPDNEDEPDIFIHANTLSWAGVDRLNQGDKVHFEVKINGRTGKLAATDLKILERAKAEA